MFDSETIAWMEKQLACKLPASYVEQLVRYPFSRASSFYDEEFWGDAQMIVAHNLSLRNEFDEATWPRNWLAIGNDDCGHIYFLDGDEAEPNVWGVGSGELADGEDVELVQMAPNVALWIEQIKKIEDYRRL